MFKKCNEKQKYYSTRFVSLTKSEHSHQTHQRLQVTCDVPEKTIEMSSEKKRSNTKSTWQHIITTYVFPQVSLTLSQGRNIQYISTHTCSCPPWSFYHFLGKQQRERKVNKPEECKEECEIKWKSVVSDPLSLTKGILSTDSEFKEEHDL